MWQIYVKKVIQKYLFQKILWQKQKVQLRQPKFHLEKEKKVVQKNRSINTIEPKKITEVRVNKNTPNSGYFNVYCLLKEYNS
jgi:hypothetical protein